MKSVNNNENIVSFVVHSSVVIFVKSKSSFEIVITSFVNRVSNNSNLAFNSFRSGISVELVSYTVSELLYSVSVSSVSTIVNGFGEHFLERGSFEVYFLFGVFERDDPRVFVYDVVSFVVVEHDVPGFFGVQTEYGSSSTEVSGI